LPDALPVSGLASFSSAALAHHRQVTDAYLLELAAHHHAKLATLDAGIKDLLRAAAREAGPEELIAFIAEA